MMRRVHPWRRSDTRGLAPPSPTPFVLACALLAWAPPSDGQVVRRAVEPESTVADSSDALGHARGAQARFERRRWRLLPWVSGSYGGACDENVGRFCTWYDEGEWVPEPEPEALTRLRDRLVAELDSIQALVPGDAWVLGQRVWYLAEGKRWAEALEAARTCGPGVAAWWCHALEGFALHGLGRFEASERAYERALRTMEPERAAAWRIPRRALDGEARRYLRPDGPELDERLGRLWTMADPLLLVPGNDRMTAHYARWTFSALRERARNPFQIPWGKDLEELTVRHGWELGWERQRTWGGAARDGVVGHKHPEGRDYIPPGRALVDPVGAEWGDFRADRTRPRSLYAPPYAPVLLPMEGQLALFPRAGAFVVVSTHFVPEDTTWHRGHGHARPWMDPGPDQDAPDRIGLFLVPLADATPLARSRAGAGAGALRIDAPAGSYLVSAEAWSPARRIAGRYRRGIRVDSVPPDVVTLSDLLLVRPGLGSPGALAAVSEHALARPMVEVGGRVGVAWEVSGLGWRPERIAYTLSVERTGRSLLRRAAERVGLLSTERPVAMTWEEEGPATPGPSLRYVDLDVSSLAPGRHRVLLEARFGGRGVLVARSELVVVDALGPPS